MLEARLAALAVGHDVDARLDLPSYDLGDMLRQSALKSDGVINLAARHGAHRFEHLWRPRQAPGVGGANMRVRAPLHTHREAPVGFRDRHQYPSLVWTIRAADQ